MFLQYWQIVEAMEKAKAANPKSLIGSRVSYCFCHPPRTGELEEICGLFGWIYEHRNPDAPESEPMDLVIAIDTSIDEWFVAQEVKAKFSREQIDPIATVINQFERSDDIDNVMYGKSGE